MTTGEGLHPREHEGEEHQDKEDSTLVEASFEPTEGEDLWLKKRRLLWKGGGAADSVAGATRAVEPESDPLRKSTVNVLPLFRCLYPWAA